MLMRGMGHALPPGASHSIGIGSLATRLLHKEAVDGQLCRVGSSSRSVLCFFSVFWAGQPDLQQRGFWPPSRDVGRGVIFSMLMLRAIGRLAVGG